MSRAISRRMIIGSASAVAALTASARGAVFSDTPLGEVSEAIALWPGIPPGGDGVRLMPQIDEKSANPVAYHARWISGVDTPSLHMFRPDKPDGSALLVVPGGGYAFLSVDNEGIEVARRLRQSGLTVFVLLHRLPKEGWANAALVPLQDAQRAMRLIRSHAARLAIDPDRIGVLGFSAGGHVAASLATRWSEPVYSPVDASDAYSPAPAFQGLIYPVITMGEGTHRGSRDSLLGENATAKAIEAASCETRVTAQTPSAFICLAAHDDIVPCDPNGLAMFDALRKASISTELHVFEDGKHGFGARAVKGTAPSLWPELLLHWGCRKGWFRDASARPG